MGSLSGSNGNLIQMEMGTATLQLPDAITFKMSPEVDASQHEGDAIFS